MVYQNSHRRLKFHVEKSMLIPRSYILGLSKKKQFGFIRRHPIISILGAGLVAYFGLSPVPRMEPEVNYHKEIIEIPEIPEAPLLEELLFQESPSRLETIADVFNEEKSWDEYSDSEKEMFAKHDIRDEESYIDFAEGRADIELDAL